MLGRADRENMHSDTKAYDYDNDSDRKNVNRKSNRTPYRQPQERNGQSLQFQWHSFSLSVIPKDLSKQPVA